MGHMIGVNLKFGACYYAAGRRPAHDRARAGGIITMSSIYSP